MSFERRLATILSADLAGYCIKMGQNDEQTLSRLLACREAVSEIVLRMGGRMFGIAGDSWMAEFASPVRALNCAAACQRALEQLNRESPEGEPIRFRMGLHMGDVIVEETACFGDEVNVAARLQEACHPGQIVISDAVFRHVVGKSDLRFGALGPIRLKNIARDIVAFSAIVQDGDRETVPANVLAALDVALPVPGFNGKPAIAVLPFQCHETGHEHICEGLAEDLIDALSNLRWLPVISRSSSFIFNGHILDARTIGRTLGARYLVSGSIRFAGTDLRLFVDLTDADTGLSLWSERFRMGFERLFALQDEIIASVVSLLDGEIDRAEQSRLRERKEAELGSWELLRRGVWHLHKFTEDDAIAARVHFEAALKRDGASSEARIHLSWWHFWDVWTKRRDTKNLRPAENLAREALAIDPRDARAHLLVGIALFMTKRTGEARLNLYNAIHLNPSLASAYACLGSSFILDGLPGKAISPLRLSIRLNPHDPFMFHFLGELAIAFHMQGDWEKACEFAGRSLQLRPGYWYAKAILIASLARAEKWERARAFAAEPATRFSAEQLNWLPFIDEKWNGYLREGLELAGCRISELEVSKSRREHQAAD